jgi:acyl-coenzyme A synthetase/AMP-(fatty) acid ligase
MTAQKIYRSTYPPAYCPTNLSISQYLTQYNPDAVYKDKIILEDNWTGHALTYGGFHNNTARHAWSLKEKYSLVAGDVVAISAPNSVRLYWEPLLRASHAYLDLLRLLMLN